MERELADVMPHDPHVRRRPSSLEEAVADADVVVVAANHAEFREPATLATIAGAAGPECLVVDPWNCWGPARCSPTPASWRLGWRAYEHKACPRARVGAPSDGPAQSMSRVLVTGGAGTIGAAVVKRLLADPAYEVRVSDQRSAPLWMREGCEVHTGDLRDFAQARLAMDGCSHVIHLAAIVGGIANFHKPAPHPDRGQQWRSTTPSSGPRSTSK